MVDKACFGEGKSIEFKRELPKKHERFLKDIIAFSNSAGGKVILGVEDITNTVYGIGDANPFKLSDDISNMISDACVPQIIPDITAQTLEGKTVLVIDVAPGRFRPYYLKSEGKKLPPIFVLTELAVRQICGCFKSWSWKGSIFTMTVCRKSAWFMMSIQLRNFARQ